MSLLKQFEQTEAGSVNQISDIKERIGSQGQFDRLTGIDVVINSWRNILLTRKGTYPNDPTYGSRLYEYVFDPFDGITKTNILSEVKNVLPRYDDRAILKNVNIQPMTAKKGYAITILVEYEGQEKETTVRITEQ